MKVEIIPNPPRARCYICHKPDVEKVCHHCGRAICSEHNSASIPAETGCENLEFSGLELDQLQGVEEIVHCSNCIHYLRSYKRLRPWAVMIGGLGLALGLIGIADETWWVSLMGVAAVTASIVWYRWIGRKHEENYEKALLRNRPPFPVVPALKTVSATEYVDGQIRLDSEGKYTAQVCQKKGRLTFTLQFAHRDKERLKRYLDKYKQSMSDDIPFHAGFVVLEGTPNLQFDDTAILAKERANTIALNGTLGEQPFLFNIDSQRDSNWTNRLMYTVPDVTDNQTQLPIRIIPTLVQEGAQRAIELVVQVSPEVLDTKAFGNIRIEEFVLYAPHRLSKVAMVEPSAVTENVPNKDDESEHELSVIWKGVNIHSGNRRERRQRFFIRFENRIEPTTSFRGRLRVCFEGTLSQLAEVKFFFPWGQKRPEHMAIQQQTYFDVDFELNLGGLRFQEMVSETVQLTHEGVLPNHTIVTRLTDNLNKADFYVKRVIENPARTSKAGAHITNRYWDIAGRCYQGVYPIDFHLVLTGEEAYGSASDSKVQVDITVQGIITNDEMREKISQLRDQLSAITENTLASIPPMPVRSVATEVPVTDQRIANRLIFRAGPSAPSNDPTTSDRVSRLMDRLEKLDEALINGRISEERYDDMRKRVENQLAELGKTSW